MAPYQLSARYLDATRQTDILLIQIHQKKYKKLEKKIRNVNTFHSERLKNEKQMK